MFDNEFMSGAIGFHRLTERPIMQRTLLGVFVLTCWVGHASAEKVRGFVEPYRSVEVSSSEMGLLAAVNVVEGQRVVAGDVLGQLDDRVLLSTLDIMQSARVATGALDAATVELKVTQQVLAGYQSLAENGNASQREIDRATSDVDQAVARIKAAKEQTELRNLEFQRTIVQIEQKKLRAPFDGIVVSIDKQPGEFVSPTDPMVMKLIQVDNLKCSLTVPHHALGGISVGDVLTVNLGAEERRVDATIEFISPMIDPQSGTITVKVRIPNLDGELKAGLVCRCDFGSSYRSPTVGLRNANLN